MTAVPDTIEAASRGRERQTVSLLEKVLGRTPTDEEIGEALELARRSALGARPAPETYSEMGAELLGTAVGFAPLPVGGVSGAVEGTAAKMGLGAAENVLIGAPAIVEAGRKEGLGPALAQAGTMGLLGAAIPGAGAAFRRLRGARIPKEGAAPTPKFQEPDAELSMLRRARAQAEADEMQVQAATERHQAAQQSQATIASAQESLAGPEFGEVPESLEPSLRDPLAQRRALRGGTLEEPPPMKLPAEERLPVSWMPEQAIPTEPVSAAEPIPTKAAVKVVKGQGNVVEFHLRSGEKLEAIPKGEYLDLLDIRASKGGARSLWEAFVNKADEMGLKARRGVTTRTGQGAQSLEDAIASGRWVKDEHGNVIAAGQVEARPIVPREPVAEGPAPKAARGKVDFKEKLRALEAERKQAAQVVRRDESVVGDVGYQEQILRHQIKQSMQEQFPRAQGGRTEFWRKMIDERVNAEMARARRGEIAEGTTYQGPAESYRDVVKEFEAGKPGIETRKADLEKLNRAVAVETAGTSRAQAGDVMVASSSIKNPQNYPTRIKVESVDPETGMVRYYNGTQVDEKWINEGRVQERPANEVFRTFVKERPGLLEEVRTR
ncbi:MAG: hypothetical protein ACRDGM_10445, partial [bacterium]